MKHNDLGDLADPKEYHAPIDIAGESGEVLESQLRSMLTIRAAEERLALMRKEGAIGGPVHLGAGQEAIAAGVSRSLRTSDRVFGAHRSHSHVLALGSSLHGLFAEVLGKKTGLSRGMGGSMHLWDGAVGFYGSVPIVAGAVPLAVGAGLAAKFQGRGDVAVTYLGDGAMEEGVVHESLNLARIQNIPVLFVVENNFFSSHMHVALRQPSNTMSRFAAAHEIPFEVVDGNDVVAVYRASARLVARARGGDGPGFIEAVTYRWYGHVDWREDIDVGVARSAEDLKQWKARDPISRLARSMTGAGLWSEDQHRVMLAEVNAQVDDAWERAMSDPWPERDSLMGPVYATDVASDHV